MKKGDTVQVRRFDGVDHWLFATLQDPATNRVQINHPGNPEHEKMFLAAAEDIRTKDDLKKLIDQVKTILAQAHHQHGLSETQLRQLGELDGFWLAFTSPKDGRLTEHQSKHLVNQRTTLHRRVVEHYQVMMKRLS